MSNTYLWSAKNVNNIDNIVKKAENTIRNNVSGQSGFSAGVTHQTVEPGNLVKAEYLQQLQTGVNRINDILKNNCSTLSQRCQDPIILKDYKYENGKIVQGECWLPITAWKTVVGAGDSANIVYDNQHTFFPYTGWSSTIYRQTHTSSGNVQSSEYDKLAPAWNVKPFPEYLGSIGLVYKPFISNTPDVDSVSAQNWPRISVEIRRFDKCVWATTGVRIKYNNKHTWPVIRAGVSIKNGILQNTSSSADAAYTNYWMVDGMPDINPEGYNSSSEDTWLVGYTVAGSGVLGGSTSGNIWTPYTKEYYQGDKYKDPYKTIYGYGTRLAANKKPLFLTDTWNNQQNSILYPSRMVISICINFRVDEITGYDYIVPTQFMNNSIIYIGGICQIEYDHTHKCIYIYELQNLHAPNLSGHSGELPIGHIYMPISSDAYFDEDKHGKYVDGFDSCEKIYIRLMMDHYSWKPFPTATQSQLCYGISQYNDFAGNLGGKNLPTGNWKEEYQTRWNNLRDLISYE